MNNLTKFTKAAIVILISITVWGINISTSNAATITVDTTADIVNSGNSDGACSLREAVISANNDVSIDTCTAGNGTDTIILNPGEYILSFPGSTMEISSNMSITGTDPAVTIINGNIYGNPDYMGGYESIFHITNSISTPLLNVTINGITITKGFNENFGAIYIGRGTLVNISNAIINDNFGSIYIARGHANISNTTIASNRSMNGGGVECNRNGTLLITDSIINENQADGAGGGIYLYSCDTSITNSLITNNTSFNDGGGIYENVLSNIKITDSIISGNSSDSCAGGLAINSWDTAAYISNTLISDNNSVCGGGLLINSPVNIFDSAIYNNTTTGDSAGILRYGHGEVNIYNSSISNNTTPGPGGGIYQAFDGTLNIHNSTISENQADVGGGLYLEYSAMVNIYNSTIAHNSASTSGGGISLQDSSINIGGTIISNNTAPTSGADCYVSNSTLTSLGYNIVNDVSSGDCTFASTGDQTGVDPLLGPLADNGGPTMTHALLWNSPAIDAGDPACASGTDQRGYMRPVGSACDIGAYEYREANLFISENTLNFGLVNSTIAVSNTVTIINVGVLPIEISQVGESDPLAAPFSIVSDTCSNQSLASGETCDITVRFEPSTIAAAATGLGSLGIVMLGVVLGSGISRRRKNLALLLIGAVIAVSMLTACGSSSTSDPITASDSFNIPTNDADNPNITINVNGSY